MIKEMFLVSHSHNDPGWKLNVDEYYDWQSTHILDTIVETIFKVTILPALSRRLTFEIDMCDCRNWVNVA